MKSAISLLNKLALSLATADNSVNGAEAILEGKSALHFSGVFV
jgi:hypothetical protein